MKSIDEQKELFTKILDMLEQHFGQSCEIVLHDLTREYDHTIVDIRNGHITGRKVGDCGSNLGLEVLRGTVVNGDRFNYISHTTDAKILRSSSIYFHDDQQRTIGSICINTDITESVRCEAYLHALNNYSLQTNEKPEIFATDVKQLLEHFLQEGERLVGKPAALMDKADRNQFLQYLDANGAFLIHKSSDGCANSSAFPAIRSTPAWKSFGATGKTPKRPKKGRIPLKTSGRQPLEITE